MLKLTLELYNAVTGKRETLGHITVTNDGITSQETDGEYGSYDVKVYHGEKGDKPTHTRIDGFARRKADAWDLAVLALLTYRNWKLGPEEKG